MKSLFFTFCFIFISLSLFSQSTDNIKRGFAFYRTVTRGTIAVDDNGQPVQNGTYTERFLYVESIGIVKPNINTVIYKGILYNATVFPQPGKIVNIGIQQRNKKPVVLVAAKGNSLWKIELSQPPSDNIKREKLNSNKILLRGKNRGRSFTFLINSDIQLEHVEGI